MKWLSRFIGSLAGGREARSERIDEPEMVPPPLAVEVDGDDIKLIDLIEQHTSPITLQQLDYRLKPAVVFSAPRELLTKRLLKRVGAAKVVGYDRGVPLLVDEIEQELEYLIKSLHNPPDLAAAANAFLRRLYVQIGEAEATREVGGNPVWTPTSAPSAIEP